MLISKYNML